MTQHLFFLSYIQVFLAVAADDKLFFFFWLNWDIGLTEWVTGYSVQRVPWPY